MLDLSYFQSNSKVDIEVFTNAGSFSTWVKPRGAKVVNILCIGSGSGGGGGFQANTITKTGGSGGSSGAITRAQFMASSLPDILYVYPGIGGEGGLGGVSPTAGGSGGSSYVTLTPAAVKGTSDNVLVISGVSTTSSGGSAGISTGTPTTASAEGSSSISSSIFLGLSNFISTAGVLGGTGTSVSGGTVTVSNILTGGGGGGGTAGATGFNATGPVPALPSTIANQKGADGIIIYKPILAFTGGIGGGGGTTGGNGGNGAYGCGGGGGGGGTTSAGNGGKGGGGLIIITTYR